jgi:hypothetical protein
MKAPLLLPATLLLSLGFAPIAQPTPPTPASTTQITGDYVEARTASVFAGACHFNGEVVTTGCDAVMAWHFTGGTWKGTDVTGVLAMAAVNCSTNLRDEQASRRSELVVDPAATPAQAAAVTDLLQTKLGTKLGHFASVRRESVLFTHTGRAYAVNAPTFASLSVQPMPNDDCCSQPSLVWYTPLTPLEHRKVGYTHSAAYLAGTLADAWQRTDENSAFYGTFAF